MLYPNILNLETVILKSLMNSRKLFNNKIIKYSNKTFYSKNNKGFLMTYVKELEFSQMMILLTIL
jgi:hypothetical protein